MFISTLSMRAINVYTLNNMPGYMNMILLDIIRMGAIVGRSVLNQINDANREESILILNW